MKYKYTWEELVKDCKKFSNTLSHYDNLISSVTPLDSNSIIPAALISYLSGVKYVEKAKATSATLLVASELSVKSKTVLPQKYFMLVALFSTINFKSKHLTLYDKDSKDVIIFPWQIKVVKKNIK